MKKTVFITFALIYLLLTGCNPVNNVQVAATTAPVYEFTTRICSGTDISVGRIITESVSCLHDYTLQTEQMRMIENAQIIVLSGAGLEDFLSDALSATNSIIDASASIELLCGTHKHDHEHKTNDHHHEQDPHIWLSPANARKMAENICSGLKSSYPQYAAIFNDNLNELVSELNELENYGKTELRSLNCRQIITFHDGFSYLADAFQLEILHAIEEESGSEASAAELIDICKMVDANNLTAVFTEYNGSVSAAEIISAETGAAIYKLDMAMSGNGYFNAMYHNINTLKEALG